MNGSFVKEVPASSLPRERLVVFGERALSDQELLAILLRTGTKERNVLELARDCLCHFENLYQLKKATLEEIQEVVGIGQIKATEIMAAIELGRRLYTAGVVKNGRITSSFELAQQLIAEMKDHEQEHLLVLYLNTKNEVIKRAELFIGSLNQSVAHPREIFKLAVKLSAARLIVVHNHPSGNPHPSEHDVEFTKRLVKCGELMGIQVLDHVITGFDSYVSLREEGVI